MTDRSIDRKIYVGGLPDSVTEQILQSLFLTFGEIKNLEMPRDPGSIKHKGFGFVEYEEMNDAEQAIDNMHESEVFGNIIKVQKARKTTGPMNRAIWEDEEYQKKYGDVFKENDPKANPADKPQVDNEDSQAKPPADALKKIETEEDKRNKGKKAAVPSKIEAN